MTGSVLPTALAFARHQHAVFPVNWPVERSGQLFCSCNSDRRGKPCGAPAKHPYGILASNGLLSATTDSGIIKDWFGRQAPQANLGVVTDKMVVIDVDPRHDGDESFAALTRAHGAMPPTWRALTGGGGEHVMFAAPDGIAIASVAAATMDDPPLGPGIDIRARGGYIVAPPSRHISGRPYAWSVDHHPQDVKLAPAPDWLIARLKARTPASRSSAVAPIPAGAWARLTQAPVSTYRDLAAARLVGHLFRHSVDFQLARGLVHAWNSAWCRPPLGCHDLDRIIDRIAAREAARIERELAP